MLDGVLADFLKMVEAELTGVLDRGGNVISQYGDMAVMDVTIIAALAAGSFAATRELARRIGEVEFNALYHQGNGSHIFMNSVDDETDRKSTRLNSSHQIISYAVFCLKKKKKIKKKNI